MIRRSMTGRSTLAALGLAAGLSAAYGCYTTGDGSAPPGDKFYFPVGIVVAKDGKALYVANSDFDLQFNGGTVQAYDLPRIRDDAVKTIASNGTSPDVKTYAPRSDPNDCPTPAGIANGGDREKVIGQYCAPPTLSQDYEMSAVTIGAFASDLQLSVTADRLFLPVRGNASLTYINLVPDDPFAFDCGQGLPPREQRYDSAEHRARAPRCADDHRIGNSATTQRQYNTRGIDMPGEPFGLALSPAGDYAVVTHQNDTKTSLLSTGCQKAGCTDLPSLQFVLDGVPVGGNGVTAVPPNDEAYDDPAKKPRDAYLETSRSVAEIDLLRFYDDQTNGAVVQDGGVVDGGPQSSLHRPFLLREAAFSVTANASGVDSRGVVIDDTPRRACRAAHGGEKATLQQRKDCARLPARVFIANRSPASIIFGELGKLPTLADPTYDPDRLVLFGNEPLTVGPSKLYLAPIIDADGNFALRVFVVCFDSATIFVWDPDEGRMENIIRVGSGPFAMAFDPFTLDDVASHAAAPVDPKAAPGTLGKYRFAYIASFTNSFVQVLDLDQRNPATYERVVFTLGQPTLPKGSH
jgi:hypothetical protein